MAYWWKPDEREVPTGCTESAKSVRTLRPTARGYVDHLLENSEAVYARQTDTLLLVYELPLLPVLVHANPATKLWVGGTFSGSRLDVSGSCDTSWQGEPVVQAPTPF